jgi:hypothetical protein
MSKVISVNGWITCKPAGRWDNSPIDGLSYSFWDFKPSGLTENVVVTEHTLTFEIPDGFNPNGQFVAALEEKKKELQAEFTKRITEIQAEINKLTAITCDEVTQ